MSARTPAAFVTSLALHGLVVVLALLLNYTASWEKKAETKPFELVAGEGDNFAATEAPALGNPSGIKLNVPTPPVPTPAIPTPEPIKPEPEPVAPDPTPTKPSPPEPKPTPTLPQDSKKTTTATKAPSTKTLAEQMRWEAIKAESKIKQQVAKEKAAEKKKLDQERAEEAKRAKVAAVNAPRVDAVGIAKGVLGGSTNNKDGGAGGKALTRTDGPAMEAYFAMLRERLVRALDKPPGLSETLVAEVEFRIGADGTLSGVKIIGPSGSAEFDRALLDAYTRVRLPARPDGKSSVHSLRFRTKDLAEG